MNIYAEPPPGMCVVPEDDITKVSAQTSPVLDQIEVDGTCIREGSLLYFLSF